MLVLSDLLEKGAVLAASCGPDHGCCGHSLRTQIGFSWKPGDASSQVNTSSAVANQVPFLVKYHRFTQLLSRRPQYIWKNSTISFCHFIFYVVFCLNFSSIRMENVKSGENVE